jgi:PKD repeat protein
MALVYICDFCGQPITDRHYFFTVQSRTIETLSEDPAGAREMAPALPDKTKMYAIHGNHFDDDPGAVATALYMDFNSATEPPGPQPPPSASFSVASVQADTHAFTFTADESFGLTYAWDLGDGTSGVDRSVSHRYVDVGTYTITLTVTRDSDGATGTASANVVVSDPEPTVQTPQAPAQAKRANPRDHLT